MTGRLAVYALGLGVFAVATSEYMVAGFLPLLAGDLGVSVAAAGYLVTVYAGAMAIGGPVLTLALARLRPRAALVLLVAVLILAQAAAALAPSYPVLVGARLLGGVAASAYIGVALSIGAQVLGSNIQGRAAAIIIGGLTVGTVVGLPVATVIAERAGWRASFWAVGGLALLAGMGALAALAPSTLRGQGPILAELSTFRNARLWAVFATSLLLIAATFAAFTYLVPILTNVTGFSTGSVPLLLAVYGAATVLGNVVVGRLADRHAVRLLCIGLTALFSALVLLALGAEQPVLAVAAMTVIGLAGVSMNPAMVTRGLMVGGSSPLVNSVHTSFIMLGVVLGSWLGGLSLGSDLGLVAPLWVGAGLALLGLMSLLPERSAAVPRRESAPAPR